MAYSDRKTETCFYVESDGHHVAAVRFDGTVLWTHDLYADVKRVVWEREASADTDALDRLLRGEAKDRKISSISRADYPDRDKVFLSIAFNSGDFGVVDATSGAFVSMGRD